MNKELLELWNYKWFGFRNVEGNNDSQFSHYLLVSDFIDMEWQPVFKDKIIKYLHHLSGAGAELSKKKLDCYRVVNNS